MASEASDIRPTQPLLHNYNTSDSDDASFSKSPNAFLRDLEDGDVSTVDSDDEELRPRPAFWRRLLMSIRRRHGTARDSGFEGVKLPKDDKRRTRKYKWRKRCVAKACVVVPLLVVIFFGLVHILNVFLGFLPLLWDDPAASALDWYVPDKASSDMASHLLDITRDVAPIHCHSHNDYWRRVPLYDALRWGCTGVEADVWLFDEELYVGHNTNALTRTRTFRSMYVDPLLKMLDRKNELGEIATTSDIKHGVFDTAPDQTLVLLVDFKNNGHDIFPVVSQHLAALREKGYLTYFNGEATIEGPITVVATGNAPFDLVTANSTYRDIFFDAPLDSLYESRSNSISHSVDKSGESVSVHITERGGQGTVGTTPSSHFDFTNSYYASVNFGSSIGWLWFGHISDIQLDLIRGQIRGAHARGLKARYWGAPKWPIGLRNKVWKLLVEEGVDYLNGDDLHGMTRLDWSLKKHWGLIS
ncbi:Altered inheritance of mitochondria protein 6 [Neocucurbitaria cava]|uniref:Altered inheritance of mitochondria protein 6 n=1 Tax=Neocucurbitaria cava TaxID=798079 RepID=A0A9W9CGP7_9PLEO|nr:Altered inheritance of mitochondria protein 6 [Neocucurbitaria cava]